MSNPVTEEMIAGNHRDLVGLMPEKRRWVKHESNMIEAKNNLLRQRSLDICTKQKLEKDTAMKESHENRSRRWLAKTKNSPYSVNLVAEDERVQEEHKTRTNDQKAEYIDTEDRREKAKNDIILRALAEFSDLEALRREKRAILEEEQRLKALLALEKSKKSGKESRMAAERAQKQRQQAKLEHRRSLYRDSLDAVLEEESIMLRRKHGM